jgi:hypothetical protein
LLTNYWIGLLGYLGCPSPVGTDADCANAGLARSAGPSWRKWGVAPGCRTRRTSRKTRQVGRVRRVGGGGLGESTRSQLLGLFLAGAAGGAGADTRASAEMSARGGAGSPWLMARADGKSRLALPGLGLGLHATADGMMALMARHQRADAPTRSVVRRTGIRARGGPRGLTQRYDSCPCCLL